MTDEPLEVLVVHKMLDGTFATADTLEKLRIVKDGFKSTAEAGRIFIWRVASFGRALQSTARRRLALNLHRQHH